MIDTELSLKKDEFIVITTDLCGKITYVNSFFIKSSGYTENEILGQPYHILCHEDMPTVILSLLWKRLKTGSAISVYIKNKNKNNSFYWGFSHITPYFNDDYEITNYYSIMRKPSKKSLSFIKTFYERLLIEEQHRGIKASEKLFHQILAQYKISYDELILLL